MQNPHATLPEMMLALKRIDELAVSQAVSDGVEGKIASLQVLAHIHRVVDIRQGPRVSISLAAGGSEVGGISFPSKLDLGGPEPIVPGLNRTQLGYLYPPSQLLGTAIAHQVYVC
jgi:hypothetical protein